MRGYNWLTLLLALTLSIGVGCGKEKDKQADKGDDKKAAKKSNIAKNDPNQNDSNKNGPGKKRNGEPNGKQPNGKQAGSKRKADQPGGQFNANGSPTGAKTVKVGTTAKAPTAKQPIDTQYITNDILAAVVVHPARVLNSRFIQNIKAEVEKEVGQKKVEDGIQMAVKELGADPRDVEQVIVLLDKRLAQDLPKLFMGGGAAPPGKSNFPEKKRDFRKGDGPKFPREKSNPRPFPKKRDKVDKKKAGISDSDGTQFVSFQPAPRDSAQFAGPTAIVRFNKAPDQKALLKHIAERFAPSDSSSDKYEAKKGFEKEPAPKKKSEDGPPKGKSKPEPAKIETKKHAGKEYHLIGGVAFCFAEDKTLLVSYEELLKRMITAKGVKSPLTKRLSTIGAEHDFILAIDMAPLKPMIEGFSDLLPPDPKAQEGFDLVRKLQTFALTGSLTGDTLCSAVLQMADEPAAARLTKTFKAEFAKAAAKGKEELKKVEELPPPLRTLVEELANGFSIQQDGTDVIIGVERPKSMDELPKHIGPMIKQARKKAGEMTRVNDMKQIGLAFHNYHDVYGHFPAADSAGYEKKGKIAGKGLSWRVHLLPQLEQSALYDQFKLDEPWDSEHNKKLISQMPEIFKTLGVKEAGKTSIHVFVGNETPFAGPKGSGIRDFRDGTSNTILAIHAGPESAETWTKPGGLQFDPSKDPTKLLGTIPRGGLLALFCDGSVHQILPGIRSDTLKLLIQPADGQPIPNDPALINPYRRRRGGFDSRSEKNSAVPEKSIRRSKGDE